jgi:hypothetical protein
VLGRYFPAFYICSALLAAEPPRGNKINSTLDGRPSSGGQALLQELPGMQLSIGIVGWITKLKSLPAALFTPISRRRFEGIASMVPQER